MAKFITVLNSNVHLSFWKAVQWADTLQEIRNNRFYTAGVNLSVPKKSQDQDVEPKTVTDTVTGSNAGARIIRLAPSSVELVRIAANTASEKLIKKIEKILK